MIKEVPKVRIDRWLWSVRIFKSRTKATEACKKGRVKIGEDPVKPSRLVLVNDLIFVRKGHFNLSFKVITLIGKRVSAKLAEPCYENLTPESEFTKFSEWYTGRGEVAARPRGSGRPTKKERRTIDDHRDKF